MKKAVIDIGTNSVKLTLGEAAAEGGARMICDMNVITKLGEGMRASGALSAEAMERTAQAVAKFAAFARAEGADEILCVGTMALRRAANAADFSSRVRELCGLGVTVLPGDGDAATPPAGASVTVELQQRIGTGDWSVYRTVTLDGALWTYTWEDLPAQQNGQSVSYRVVEQSHKPEGYIHIGTTPDYENASYTITNVAPTDFIVTKNWNDNDNTASRPASVTVALYRTTDQDQIGTAAGEPVPVDEIDDAAQRTAVLSAGNEWTFTFEDLPKYDAAGALYHYYALELTGIPPWRTRGM